MTIVTALLSGVAVFALTWIKDALRERREARGADLQRQRGAVAAFLATYNSIRSQQLIDVERGFDLRFFTSTANRLKLIRQRSTRPMSEFHSALSVMELEVTQQDVADEVVNVKNVFDQEFREAVKASDPIDSVTKVASLMVNAEVVYSIDTLVHVAKNKLH
ncbi:MAG: hypothetical protein ACTH1D_11310 [Mycobacteriaceae bacterium]